MAQGLIYTRVASKEQVANLSSETQEQACVEYCSNNGIEVEAVFRDREVSGKSTDRPQFQKMLDFCRENKARIDCIVVYAVNRFARDQYDHHVVRAYLSKFGITLVSITEPSNDSSTGKLMEGVLAAFAQFDNDVRGERTAAGIRAAKKKGRWPHQAPLGYSNTKGSPGPSLLPDPQRAPLIQEAFSLYSSGRYSMKQVLDRVGDRGLKGRTGKLVSRQGFAHLLRNPAYTGTIKDARGGMSFKADFEPLVDEATFERVQGLLRHGRKLSTNA